jgi:hypothetical protein
VGLENRAESGRELYIAKLFTNEPTAMSAHLYHARYSGGPCDGMAVVATHHGGEDTWSMPVATHSGQSGSGGRSSMEICQAVYKLSRTCHLIDHGTPTIRYEYEFVGLKIAGPVTGTVVSGWLAVAKNRLNRWFKPDPWLPLPEGRPKLPGQAAHLLTCPSRGLGLATNRATVTEPEPAANRGSASHLKVF